MMRDDDVTAEPASDSGKTSFISRSSRNTGPTTQQLDRAESEGSRGSCESTKDGGAAEGWGPAAPGHPVINLYLSTFSAPTSATKGALQGRRRTARSIKQAHLVGSRSAPLTLGGISPNWSRRKSKIFTSESPPGEKNP